MTAIATRKCFFSDFNWESYELLFWCGFSYFAQKNEMKNEKIIDISRHTFSYSYHRVIEKVERLIVICIIIIVVVCAHSCIIRKILMLFGQRANKRTKNKNKILAHTHTHTHIQSNLFCCVWLWISSWLRAVKKTHRIMN
jgi:hypothetical protein